MQSFAAGVSAQKVRDAAQTLMSVAASPSAASRLNRTPTEQFEAWCRRPGLPHSGILCLDGVHIAARHGDQASSTILFTALGVDQEGNKEVQALLTVVC